MAVESCPRVPFVCTNINVASFRVSWRQLIAIR